MHSYDTSSFSTFWTKLIPIQYLCQHWKLRRCGLHMYVFFKAFTLTHSLIHKLTQAIMDTYVTLEPQMLRPGRYRSDCLRAWGAVLDHQIRATSSQNATDFQLALERTKKLWLNTYGFPYLEDSPKKVIKRKVTKSKEIDIRFERTIPFSNKKMYVVQSYHVFMYSDTNARTQVRPRVSCI